LFSNASSWWIFYEAGDNYDDGRYSMSEINREIKQNAKYLEIYLLDASLEQFRRYCEDPGYLRLNTAIETTNRMISDIRGTYPELLIGAMLSAKGYQRIQSRLKPKILKEYKGTLKISGDLDVVGVKEKDLSATEIIIFESKGQSITDKELDEELNKFSNTIKVLKGRLKSFGSELGIQCNLQVNLKGIFVSMAKLNRNLPRIRNNNILSGILDQKPKYDVPQNIELWDFSDLIRELKQAGIPEEYISLIKKSEVSTLIEF
jgi:hypothetical protein